jgi:hypothetical protein
MLKKQIKFKIIEHRPTIPNINDYRYQIICNDTNFKDYLYCNQNNEIIDTTNLNKSLKYIIKLMKNDKILGLGSLIINNDLFMKKIRRKIYNNINIFITNNNYPILFPQANGNIIKQGLFLSLEVFINYIKEKKEKYKERSTDKQSSPGEKKYKFIKRNISFKNNEYSVKSLNNNLTTSASNINTYNNINNCYDTDNLSESNLNIHSSEKINNINISNALSPVNITSNLSETDIKSPKKKTTKKGAISSKNIKKKQFKFFTNKTKNKKTIFLTKQINKSSSRTSNFIFTKKAINFEMTQDSSWSKTSNSITPSSIIDSALIEKDINLDKINEIGNRNKYLYSRINNNKIFKDNDDIKFNLLQLDNRKNKIFKKFTENNKQMFYLQEKEKKLINIMNNYYTKIINYKFIINHMKSKIGLKKDKEAILYNQNKNIIPIISKVQESKKIENNIINLIIKTNENTKENKYNTLVDNNIKKNNKNLMIKALKNIIQTNQDIYSCLNDEMKNKLKYICNKYHIFDSIIEEKEE